MSRTTVPGEAGTPGPTVFTPSLGTVLRENLSSLGTLRTVIHARRSVRSDALDEAPVLLLPGFLSGDWVMMPLARLLAERGHPTHRSHVGANVSCTTELLDRLEARLEQLAERHGQPLAIVGWSRGGTLGKLLAVRRPDLVNALVTLASPNVNPLAISSLLARQIEVLTRLNAAGVRRVISQDCIDGECAQRVVDGISAEFPAHIPYTSIFSRADGVVNWEACRDPQAAWIEVHARHLNIGADPHVMNVVADLLDPAT